MTYLHLYAPFMASVTTLPASSLMLQALDRLQWRPPFLRSIVFQCDLTVYPQSIVFSMMRLDVWEEALFLKALDHIDVASLSIKDLIKVLMSLCYFDVNHPVAHTSFRCLMAKVEPPDCSSMTPLLSQLLTLEIALRTTHWNFRCSKMTFGWLQRHRFAKLVPDETFPSDFQKDVAQFITPLGFEEEVPIGPYTADFKYENLIVETDGQQHCYRNTEELTALTKLRSRLLTRLGFTLLHIPSSTWKTLNDDEEKGQFLEELLKPHVQHTPRNCSDEFG